MGYIPDVQHKLLEYIYVKTTFQTLPIIHDSTLKSRYDE